MAIYKGFLYTELDRPSYNAIGQFQRSNWHKKNSKWFSSSFFFLLSYNLFRCLLVDLANGLSPFIFLFFSLVFFRLLLGVRNDKISEIPRGPKRLTQVKLEPMMDYLLAW